MTNKEWLDYLAHNAPDELAAWFDAERITNQAEMLHMPEPHESATMQQIRQVIEDTVKRGVYGDTEPQDADSRDKLEADIRDTVPEWHVDTIIGWLDRQAAITLAKDEAYCQECNGDYYKLQDECDELQAKVDAKDNCIENIMQTLHETQARASNLAADLFKANNERERYRSMCSDMATMIHDALMIVDEGMA